MNAFRLAAWLRRLSYAWNGRKMTYLLIHAVWVLIAFVLLGLVQIAKGAELRTFEFERAAFGGWSVKLQIEQLEHAHDNGQWRARFIATGNPANLGIGNISMSANGNMQDTGAHEVSVNSPSTVTHGWFSAFFAGLSVNSINFNLRDPYGNWTAQSFQYGVGVVIPEEALFDKTMKNESGVPMKWALYDGQTLLAEVTIQPGQTGRLTAEVDDTMDLQEQFFVQSEFSDGVWLALDDFSETPAVTKSVDIADLPPNGPPPETPPAPTPPPPGVPQGPSNSVTNINTGVWTATDDTTAAEALDKTTYRQGVDKITEAIGEGVLDITGEGGLGAGSTFDDEPGEEEVESIGGPWQNVNIAGKIPEPPEFFDGSLGSVSSVSANIPFPAPIGTWTFEADFSTHESSISLIRNVLRIGIHIGFFFLCIKTIRESSAS